MWIVSDENFFYPKNFAILFVITFLVGIVSGIWIRFFKRNLTANLKKRDYSLQGR
jgi:cytochrome bd-type quinol oxidase subunit 1